MHQKNIFRLRIRELREINNYRSQQAFADAFGIAQSTVGGWESGKREPDYDTLLRLASFFGTTADYLLGLTNRISPANTASPDWNGDLIRELRRDRNESVDQVARSLGIAPYLYHQYENCEAEPCLSDLIAISEHFGVSYGELLRRVFSEVGANDRVLTSDFRVSPQERQFLSIYRSVNEQGKKYIIKQAEFAAAQEEYHDPRQARKVGRMIYVDFRKK